MSSNALIGNMLTELTSEIVIRDKYQQMLKEKEANKPDKVVEVKNEEQKMDDDMFADDGDQELEKIMQGMMMEKLSHAKKLEKKQKETFDAGDYREITEDEFLSYVTKNVYAIVHFFHGDFERCKIIDMHLRKIAITHPETRFLCLNAEKAAFFIQKLAVRVLPTIVCFIDGVAKDRIVGFEELGNTDQFDTLVLTRRLVKSGVLKPKNKFEKGFQMKYNNKKGDDSDGEYEEKGYNEQE